MYVRLSGDMLDLMHLHGDCKPVTIATKASE